MDTEMAWLAGIVDGEGYVGIMSNGVGVRKVAAIDVRMTCKETIERCHEIAGCGQMRRIETPHKPIYLWRVKCHDAIRVAKEIYPYSITKKIALRRLINST